MSHSNQPDNRECKDIRAELSEIDLPLPDPYPEYVECPYCGEPEVEVWCYQLRAQCHVCGGWIEHAPPACFGCEECRAVMSET